MKKLFAIISATMLLTACTTTAPFQPATGLFYSNTKAPLQIDYNNTDIGTRVGKSSSKSILGLFAFGDASVQAAAREGKIRTVKHADYEFMSVLLGLFTETTVYVYGD
ncbi:MAG: TRL-like family protein [Alphaproteobacteria bacterium]|nr:TRL-like family protein [Alphaproteobacteria bacterium]